MTNWQPIETAPIMKWILVSDEEEQQFVAINRGDGVWEYAITDNLPVKNIPVFLCLAEYWMPLPPPPKKENE